MPDLAAWWKRLRGTDGAAADTARWVVVDCETSGLDVRNDRILSIGAVAIRASRIDFRDSFAVLVRQERASGAANILVHGIGGEAQVSGSEPAAAIAEFIGFADDAPLVAFHAAFDRAMLERAAQASGTRWRRTWLDLAELLPALFAARAKGVRSLDDWLEAFGIEHPARHDAVGDAYATAQLMQVAIAEGLRQGFASTRDLLGAASSARWAGN